MDPGLYIVGTPIGHLQDMTFRAVEVLREADLILAEDTRHTRKLMNHYEIHTPLTSCHKFNEASRVRMVTDRIANQSHAVALVSNAGMPVVSDPGARIVRACRAEQLMVTAIPGPSAVTTGVALSGYGGDGFHFTGFLSHKKGARARRLAQLADIGVPVVLFESPYRLVKLLGEIDANMGNRDVYVGRELTKRFEEGLFGKAADLARDLESRALKGEFVVVVAPAERAKRGPGRTTDDDAAAVDTMQGEC